MFYQVVKLVIMRYVLNQIVKLNSLQDLKEAIKKGKEGPKPEATTSEPLQHVRPPLQQQQLPKPLVDYRLSGSPESRTEILVPVSELSLVILTLTTF